MKKGEKEGTSYFIPWPSHNVAENNTGSDSPTHLIIHQNKNESPPKLIQKGKMVKTRIGEKKIIITIPNAEIGGTVV